ncbi:hypothetical protein ACFW6Q_28805 [Streptomyces sp. NPDC058737]|uniref:hypothetical protein n=1 Tax=Streptomyces sp. NPDC058737 TaxID=3346617 RepID=UPI0036C161E3
MTKKTRIRVARIAAGAVIAAGASLTAAGAASALEINIGVSTGGEEPGDDCGIVGTDPDCNTEEPGGGNTEEPGGGNTEEPGGGNTEEPGGGNTEEPGGGNTEEPGGGNTEEPGGGNTEQPGGGNTEQPGGGNTEQPGGGDNGNGNGGGGDNTSPDGGGNDNVTQDQGSSALTDTGEQAPASSNNAAQGDGKELAETGAAETTFLLVGAATMIAGGIGFRFLPRLMNGRGGAAA